MADAAYKPRMRGIYDDKIVKAMTKKFGYKNALEVPRIDKIVLNMGVGEGVADRKKVELAAADLAQIAGRHALLAQTLALARPLRSHVLGLWNGHAA